MERELNREYQHEWAQVLRWEENLRLTHGATLPAPYIFATRDDHLVLEWEAHNRSLVLRFDDEETVDFGRSDESDVTPCDEEGRVRRHLVPSLLLWVLDRR